MADAPTIETIQQQLCTEIQTLCSLKPGAVGVDTSLPSLAIDSLKLVSLLLTIERKFAVSLMKTGIKREDLQSVRTLAAAVVARRKA